MRKRKALLIPAAGIVLAAFLYPAPAGGQMACDSRAAVAENLKDSYGEVPVASGVVSANKVLEVFAARDGSFTVVMTFSWGMSCVTGAGKTWRVDPDPDYPKEKKPGA